LLAGKQRRCALITARDKKDGPSPDL